MAVNWTVFFGAALLGAVVEFYTITTPNIYKKTTSLGKVFIIAASIALLPQTLVYGALIGLIIARFGDLLAEGFYIVVVQVAVRIDRWQRQRETDGEQDNSTTTQ